MKGGRPRIPNELHVIRGTFRDHRHAGNFAKLDSAIPEPPKGISSEACEIWNDLAPDLHQAGLLKRSDKHGFACYCQAVADFYEANIKVHQPGGQFKITVNGNIIESPDVWAVKRAMEFIHKFGNEFGIGSPAARSRIDIGKAGSKPADNQPASKFGGVS